MKTKNEDKTVLYCSRCGTQNKQGSIFCTKCGSIALSQYNELQLNNDVYFFVQSKGDYYSRQFVRFRTQGKKASWNWAAFFGVPYWLIYRKMYGYGVVYIVVHFIIEIFGNDLLVSIWSIFGWAMSIIMGIFGNYIYYTVFERHLRKTPDLSENGKDTYLSKHGGTDTGAVIVTIIICVVLSIVSTMSDILR